MPEAAGGGPTPVDRACAFLRHHRVQGLPVAERVKFLKGKGVGEADISLALERCGLTLWPARPQRAWLGPLAASGAAVAAGALVASALRSSSSSEAAAAPDGGKLLAESLAEFAALSQGLLAEQQLRISALEAAREDERTQPQPTERAGPSADEVRSMVRDALSGEQLGAALRDALRETVSR